MTPSQQDPDTTSDTREEMARADRANGEPPTERMDAENADDEQTDSSPTESAPGGTDDDEPAINETEARYGDDESPA